MLMLSCLWSLVVVVWAAVAVVVFVVCGTYGYSYWLLVIGVVVAACVVSCMESVASFLHQRSHPAKPLDETSPSQLHSFVI